MLSKTGQPQKDKYCMTAFKLGTQSSHSQRGKAEWWLPRAGGQGRGELAFNGTETELGKMNQFCGCAVVMVEQCERTQCQRTAH